MAQINFGRREILTKLVYYGPGHSGKTTNLQVVHQRAPRFARGELVSIATEGDRTLFFDYMPLELGKVSGLDVKLQLYTVPGQPYYKATRELVLRGADGVIFVADSRVEMMEDNLRSLADLEENLARSGVTLDELPVVIQYNKRDMEGALPVAELEAALNPRGWPSYEAIASAGEGVFPSLKKLASLVLEKLHQQYVSPAERTPAPTPRAAVKPAPTKDEERAARRAERERRRAEQERPRPAPRESSESARLPKVQVADRVSTTKPAPAPTHRVALLVGLLLLVAAVGVGVGLGL